MLSAICIVGLFCPKKLFATKFFTLKDIPSGIYIVKLTVPNGIERLKSKKRQPAKLAINFIPAKKSNAFMNFLIIFVLRQ